MFLTIRTITTRTNKQIRGEQQEPIISQIERKTVI